VVVEAGAAGVAWVRGLLTDRTSWMTQCRTSMYWYSSQQLRTVTSSGFSRLCHPGEAGVVVAQPGPWSRHQDGWEDRPRDRMSLSCNYATQHNTTQHNVIGCSAVYLQAAAEMRTQGKKEGVKEGGERSRYESRRRRKRR